MKEKIPQIEKFNFCSECGHEKPGHFLECSSSEKPKDDKEYIISLDEELAKLRSSLESGNYQGFTHDIERRIEKLNKTLGELLDKLESTDEERDPWLVEMEKRRRHYEHHGDGPDHWVAQREGRPVKKTTAEEQPKTEERPKAPELSEAQEKIKKIFLEKLKDNYSFATHGGRETLRQVLKEVKDDGFWSNPVEKHRPSFLNALVTNIDEIYSNQALGTLKDKTTVIEYVYKNLEKEFDAIVGKDLEIDPKTRKDEIATIKLKIRDAFSEFNTRAMVRSLVKIYINKTEDELSKRFGGIKTDKIIKKRAFSYFAQNMKREFPQIEGKIKDKITKALAMAISGVDLGA